MPPAIFSAKPLLEATFTTIAGTSAVTGMTQLPDNPELLSVRKKIRKLP